MFGFSRQGRWHSQSGDDAAICGVYRMEPSCREPSIQTHGGPDQEKPSGLAPRAARLGSRSYLPGQPSQIGGSDEYDRAITIRWIGGVLRKRLNIQTYKSHGVYVVPINERPKIEMLCARYGVDFNRRASATTTLPLNDAPQAHSGDEGTLGTS
jgi:hypothetical protein